MSAFGNDMSFDRDDLVGIALGIDDPLYLEQVHSYAIENHIIDESGVDGSFSEIINREMNQSIPGEIDMDFSDLEPEDDDITYDGMDVEDYADSDFEILSGEADDEVDMLDFIDMEEK